MGGRNGLGWDERLALDLWYVEHGDLGVDLRVLAQTVSVILRREGIAAAGHETMPEFRLPSSADGGVVVSPSSAGPAAVADAADPVELVEVEYLDVDRGGRFGRFVRRRQRSSSSGRNTPSS